jgi:hypothetical protein
MENPVKTETKTSHAFHIGKPIVSVIAKKHDDDDDDEKTVDGKTTSSKSVERFDEIDQRVSKMAHRVTRAMDVGVETYIDRRNKSARDRKDGAYVDLGENLAHGLSKAVAEGAPIIADMGEMLNSRPIRKQLRSVAKAAGSIPGVR